ncbi:hypothetical protein OT_ostta10g01930 [Ostreococcus tauri]|uniref:Uncharacterized protein n=1 Tax=Ostreococcus tauri TaxID=70448 RepID=A0A090N475_OSTTA|nr:hypothetical protein OT_ostta10g01930 [Ostreococcus tauri]CEF99378.1 hypothetical protein OT_ostta10g01930 [Ostreococcus tauri]|eukprot:XP_022839804.1 hypothetical protein OT_ostta10g01930 [Ostreococcus tauri]
MRSIDGGGLKGAKFVGRRRLVTLLSSAILINASVARADNGAITAALKARERSEATARAIERVGTSDAEELGRCRRLALAGDFDDARRVLRTGSLSRLRGDAAKTELGRDVARALDAFDDALRAASLGRANMNDVREKSDALDVIVQRVASTKP